MGKLREIIETVRDRWRLPDQGIWEARNEPKHYTYSKLRAWTALDRKVRLARRLRVPDRTLAGRGNQHQSRGTRTFVECRAGRLYGDPRFGRS